MVCTEKKLKVDGSACGQRGPGPCLVAAPVREVKFSFVGSFFFLFEKKFLYTSTTPVRSGDHKAVGDEGEGAPEAGGRGAEEGSGRAGWASGGGRGTRGGRAPPGVGRSGGGPGFAGRRPRCRCACLQFEMRTAASAAVCAAACLAGAAVTDVGAFAPPPAAVQGPARARAALRCFAVPPLRPLGLGVQQRARGGAAGGLAMGSFDKSQLVTHGDIWLEVLNEDGDEGRTADTSMLEDETASENDFAYATEELSILASEVVAPIKKAAGAVGTALWSKLSPSPDDEEIQRNLKAFAKCHSGAVGTPMGDEELEKEVKYLGMFPDLVDALLEAQEEKLVLEAQEELDDVDAAGRGDETAGSDVAM